MVKSPNSSIGSSTKSIGMDLTRVLSEIDKYFGSGSDAQSSNYLKFISKGDESDSADDDEPESCQIGKSLIFN